MPNKTSEIFIYIIICCNTQKLFYRGDISLFQFRFSENIAVFVLHFCLDCFKGKPFKTSKKIIELAGKRKANGKVLPHVWNRC